MGNLEELMEEAGEQQNIVRFKLDREKIKTMDNVLDILEFLLGDIQVEDRAVDLFLQSSISKYTTRMEYEEKEDTDQSDSQSKVRENYEEEG